MKYTLFLLFEKKKQGNANNFQPNYRDVLCTALPKHHTVKLVQETNKKIKQDANNAG